MIDAAERDGLLQTGRHDRRTDLGQHRRRPGHRRRAARLPVHLRDDRQGRAGEDRVAAGVRRRGRRVPGRGRALTIRSRTTRSPSGWCRRRRARSARTSTRTSGTRWAHEHTTGPEIWRQTAGRITHFVAGVGTGGTITGVGRYLKSKNPAVQIVGADPAGSVYSGRLGPAVSRRGHRRGLLADDVRPDARRRGHPDQRRGQLPDGPPRHRRRRASSSAGPAAPPSRPRSRSARTSTADDLVVVLIPDSGRGYLSRVFDDDWMAGFGFLHSECRTVADVDPSARRRRPAARVRESRRHGARGGRT